MNERYILDTFNQVGSSCIIVSSGLILKAYTNCNVENIIELFLQKNEYLLNKYSIKYDDLILSDFDKYNFLNDNIYKASNQQIQFNHGFIKNSLNDFCESNKIFVEIPSFKFMDDYNNIETKLKTLNSFLSLSLKLRNRSSGKELDHALPIGFDDEFYAPNTWNKSFFCLGNSILQGLQKNYLNFNFDIIEIGDYLIYSK